MSVPRPARSRDKLRQLADTLHDLAKLERKNADRLAAYGYHSIAHGCERIAEQAEKTALAIYEGEYDQ
jgi:hypothetical protein